MSLFGPPKHSHFWTAKPQDSNAKTAGNELLKVSMLRGSVLGRSLLGKTIHLQFGTVVQKRLRGPSGPDRGGRQGRLGDLELGWGSCWRCGGGFGPDWASFRRRRSGFAFGGGDRWSYQSCFGPGWDVCWRCWGGFGCCGALLAWRCKTKQLRGEASELRTFGGRYKI